MIRKAQSGRWKAAAWLFCALVFSSCRGIAPLPPVNLSAPGWKLQQGQAIWRTERDAPEVAGEIIFATSAEGNSLLQLTKNPLPFVTVQTSGESWQIDFVPKRRRLSGKGTPNARLLWIHLARALSGTRPPAPLTFEQTERHGFRLENPKTGEVITGFLGE